MIPCGQCGWMLRDTDPSCNMCGTPARGGAPVATSGSATDMPTRVAPPGASPWAQNAGEYPAATPSIPSGDTAWPTSVSSQSVSANSVPGAPFRVPPPPPPLSSPGSIVGGPAAPPRVEPPPPVVAPPRPVASAPPPPPVASRPPPPRSGAPTAQISPVAAQVPVRAAPATMASVGAPPPPPLVAPPPLVSPRAAQGQAPVVASIVPTAPPPAVTAANTPTSSPRASGRRVLVGFLVSFQHDPAGRFWAVQSGTTPVGRASAEPAEGIRLADPSSSLEHAVVQADAETGLVYVQDVGSRNGTQVNDQPLAAGVPTRLFDDDRLRVGSTTFVVKLLVSDRRN